MSISASAVTRFGLGGSIWRPNGSYSGKVASPPVFAGTISDISKTFGTGTFNFDYSSYFTGATSYSISPSVESGWSFDTSTGILTIDTDDESTFGPYTITGTNAAGSDSSNSFDVEVTAAVEADDDESPTGGWWSMYDNELALRKRKKDELDKLEAKAAAIVNAVDKAIADELRIQDRDAERLNELNRLSLLAETHKTELRNSVSQSALNAVEAAINKRNFSAMERLERELAKSREEELFLLHAAGIILNS